MGNTTPGETAGEFGKITEDGDEMCLDKVVRGAESDEIPNFVYHGRDSAASGETWKGNREKKKPV
jgi:hypothetical protein